MVPGKARGGQGLVEHRGREPVRRGVNALPAQAEALVARIESMLAQAEALLARGGSDEAAYALRETERRYLPDTLDAFLGVPPALRDAAAATMLIEQLRLLERATAQRLAVLAESAENSLAANGRFLTERFGALDTLPETAVAGGADAGTAAPVALVRRVLDRLEGEAGADPIAIIERAAVRLAAAFPAITTVRHAGFLGRGPVEDIALDVPRRDDMLRYALTRTRHGIEATVTRYLRGIKNKTVAVDVAEWTRALIDDLGAYVERERGAREVLEQLFRPR
ncbi:MAG: hypothetical protein QOF71_1875 [Candidatus Eremiobacteraeota bacterium]|nr:hypothetical protein [Candidatus Eremiobacteraeota bacterium]